MNKKNLFLGVILIVLAALAWGYNGPYQDWKIKKNQPLNFLAKIDPAQVSKVEVVYNTKVNSLEREGEKWRVTGYKGLYASAELINIMTARLAEAQKAELELVSQNKDKKSGFQTDQTGTQVKLYQGNDLVAEFIVGRMGSDYSSTYISPANSDSTYLIKQVNLNAAFAQDNWLDLAIFSGEPAKINKLRFQIKGQEFVIEKKGEDWSGVKPRQFKVDKTKAEAIVAIMAQLNAVSVPEQNFSGTGLEKNDLIVQATGEGIDNTIMVGQANAEGYFYAKSAQADTIYLITKDQKDKLDTAIEKLK